MYNFESVQTLQSQIDTRLVYERPVPCSNTTGNPPPFVEFDVLLNGHTHISALDNMGDYYYINPGSVSIPKGGTTNSFIIYENREFSLRDLETCDEIDNIVL